VGQIGSLLSARTQESLPSNTDKISKEQAHAITLRSEKQLEQLQKESSEIVQHKDIREKEEEDKKRKIGQNREEILAAQPKIRPNSRTTLESEPDTKPTVKPIETICSPTSVFLEAQTKQNR